MPILPEYLHADEWLSHVFSSKAAQTGGVVRRKVRDVERLAGRRAFLEYTLGRGWQVFENNDDFVVFCNSGPIYRHGLGKFSKIRLPALRVELPPGTNYR